MGRGRPRRDDANERHPLYPTWQGMRQRCYNPKATSYKNYGARGIRINPRWDDFKLFVADMGPKPSPSHWIERVDNDGDYGPFNCVWVLPVQQSVNKRPAPARERKTKPPTHRPPAYKYERLLA